MIARRPLLQGVAATLIAPRIQAAPTADAFINSVGVNVHLASDPYAANFEHVRALLEASGIRHLRDELRPGNDLDRWRTLYAAGITGHLLVSPATNTVADMLATLAALGPGRVTAIEGQNEGDSDWFMAQPAARGDWSNTVVDYQRAVFQALRAHHPGVPVLSPSVIDWKPGDVRLLRPAAAYCDIVAIHPYVQHGQEPETTDREAALSWYLRHMRDAFKPGAPAMATEAGYATITQPGGPGISEAAAATYLPRLLLHNFAAGVLRTFLYEFMDGGTDPANAEHHWGLVRHDGSPKPAYHAIRALLAALHDPPRTSPLLPSAQPTLAKVGLLTAPPDTRMVELHKPDGSLVVAIWRAVHSWDPARAIDLPVPPQTLAFTLDRPAAHAAWLVPGEQTEWTAIPIAAGQGAFPVTDRVCLLSLSPR